MESGRYRQTQSLAVLPGVGQPGANPFSQNLPFELGKHGRQTSHRSTGQCGQIQNFGQGDETNPEVIQFL